jgi:hypothetical protein
MANANANAVVLMYPQVSQNGDLKIVCRELKEPGSFTHYIIQLEPSSISPVYTEGDQVKIEDAHAPACLCWGFYDDTQRLLIPGSWKIHKKTRFNVSGKYGMKVNTTTYMLPRVSTDVQKSGPHELMRETTLYSLAGLPHSKSDALAHVLYDTINAGTAVSWEVTPLPVVENSRGGGRASWASTTRKVTLKDGSRRVLYKNPKFPGDFRIRKMRKGRDGKLTASYVKPPIAH